MRAALLRRRSAPVPLAAAAAAATLLLCAFTAAAPASRSTPAASDQSVRHAIERAYDRNRQALRARDAAAVLALCTADFQVVTPDGAVHGAHSREAACSLFYVVSSRLRVSL